MHYGTSPLLAKASRRDAGDSAGRTWASCLKSGPTMGSKGPNLRCVHLWGITLFGLLTTWFVELPCHYLSCRSYLDKRISLHLNKKRKVSGTLRGYDQFMNIVLGDAVDDSVSGKDSVLGMVVSVLRYYPTGLIIRNVHSSHLHFRIGY